MISATHAPSLYNLGTFLVGLAGMLTVAVTLWRARTQIKHKTSASSIQGFVELVAGQQRALNACEERDRKKAERIEDLERRVFGKVDPNGRG